MLNALREGRNKLSVEAQERIKEYIRSQMVDGAFFVGKNRQKDVYYTSFGLMLCYVFDVKVNCAEARLQLEAYKPDERNLIHYAAYMRSMMLLELLDGKKAGIVLAWLLSSEAKSLPVFTEYPHSDEYSPYSVFMLVSLTEEVGLKIKNKKDVLERLKKYRVKDGGYSNVQEGMSATANATAAALCIKRQLGGNGASLEGERVQLEGERIPLGGEIKQLGGDRGQLERLEVGEDLEYLLRMQDKSGGFYTTSQSPVPDILTTDRKSVV